MNIENEDALRRIYAETKTIAAVPAPTTAHWRQDNARSGASLIS